MKTLMYVVIASIYLAPTCRRKFRMTVGAGFIVLGFLNQIAEIMAIHH